MTGSDTLPAPLVDAAVDLKDFPFTPLYRARLFGSEFHNHATDKEWRAGVTLWLKSWDQSPAGSLPDDEVSLAKIAEFSRNISGWRKISQGALHGWIKCSDGRLYHPVVADGVNEAWKRKQVWHDKAKKARAAKAAKRLSKSLSKTGNGAVKEPVAALSKEPVKEPVSALSKELSTGLKGQGQIKKESKTLPSEPSLPLAREAKTVTDTLEPSIGDGEGSSKTFGEGASVAHSVRSGRSAPLKEVKKAKKEKLRQNLIVFVNDRMVDPQKSVIVAGLCGADPEHDEQWWLDHVHKLMLAERRDDAERRTA